MLDMVIECTYQWFVLLVQMRNLLWATSKHDVYLMHNYSVMHWSSLLRRGKEVLNVAKPIVPTLVISDFFDQDRPLDFCSSEFLVFYDSGLI